MFRTRRAFHAVAAVVMALASCSEEKIRTYRIAVDDTEEKTKMPTAPTTAGALRWQAPEGWGEETAGQFQTALYRLGPDAKVSVSSLPGDAGGIAANVNRWRQQIGLAPLDDVGGEILGVEGGDISAKWFDLRGEKDSILAAIISLSGETWFFKLTASSAAADTHRDEFMSFLASVHAESKVATPKAVQSPSSQKPQINFEVPDGWEKSEGSAMRVASFRIPGSDGLDGDVSVVPLLGESGSTLENVNRWRGQLRLDPLKSEEDPALGRKVDGASGLILLTHMVSEEGIFDGDRPGAISTAIFKAGEYTWFFKLAGEAELVSRNRDKFEAFVLSAKIP